MTSCALLLAHRGDQHLLGEVHAALHVVLPGLGELPELLQHVVEGVDIDARRAGRSRRSGPRPRPSRRRLHDLRGVLACRAGRGGWRPCAGRSSGDGGHLRQLRSAIQPRSRRATSSGFSSHERPDLLAGLDAGLALRVDRGGLDDRAGARLSSSYSQRPRFDGRRQRRDSGCPGDRRQLAERHDRAVCLRLWRKPMSRASRSSRTRPDVLGQVDELGLAGLRGFGVGLRLGGGVGGLGVEWRAW